LLPTFDETAVTPDGFPRQLSQSRKTGAAHEDVAMTMFDAAVAEYLHRPDRPVPWTRRQEEDALDGLSGWLHAVAGDVPLAAVTPQIVSRYASDRHLSAEQLDELHATLASLFRWSRGARSTRSSAG
jgi:hypothetical protein